jgi:hypothetical protein
MLPQPTKLQNCCCCCCRHETLNQVEKQQHSSPPESQHEGGNKHQGLIWIGVHPQMLHALAQHQKAKSDQATQQRRQQRTGQG